MGPEELRDTAMKRRKSVHDEAFESFKEVLKKEAEDGATKVIIPAPSLPGLTFYDDLQEAFAQYLRTKGFAVKKTSVISGGVRQDPSWYLYIVY